MRSYVISADLRCNLEEPMNEVVIRGPREVLRGFG